MEKTKKKQTETNNNKNNEIEEEKEYKKVIMSSKELTKRNKLFLEAQVKLLMTTFVPKPITSSDSSSDSTEEAHIPFHELKKALKLLNERVTKSCRVSLGKDSQKELLQRLLQIRVSPFSLSLRKRKATNEVFSELDLFPKNFRNDEKISKEDRIKWNKLRSQVEQKRSQLITLRSNLATFQRLDSLLSAVNIDQLQDRNYQKEMKNELNTTLLLLRKLKAKIVEKEDVRKRIQTQKKFTLPDTANFEDLFQ